VNIVYAYYEPPHTQTMEEHVRLALEAFRESSTLVRFGQSLSPAFHTLLKLGLLLHDFGKALFPLRGTKLSFHWARGSVRVGWSTGSWKASGAAESSSG